MGKQKICAWCHLPINDPTVHNVKTHPGECREFYHKYLRSLTKGGGRIRPPKGNRKCSICGEQFPLENHQGPPDECLECQKIPAYPQYPIEVVQVDGEIKVLRRYPEKQSENTCLICGEPAIRGHYCRKHEEYRRETLQRCSEEGALFGSAGL